MRWIPIWISLATFFSCIPILSHDANHSNVSVSNGKRAHVPHILTSCTAEMDLTTGNENLLSHKHTTTRTQQIYTNTLCRANTCMHACIQQTRDRYGEKNDNDNDNNDQAHTGQNVCFSPIDLDSVEHARNVCTWYKFKKRNETIQTAMSIKCAVNRRREKYCTYILTSKATENTQNSRRGKKQDE